MSSLPSATSATASTATEGDVKTFLTALRTYIADLLGTDSANFVAVQSALRTSFCRSVSKTGAYTVVASDRGQVIECNGTFTLSITAAATLGDGFFFAVSNVGSGTVTIDPNLTETVGGATTLPLIAGESVLLYCDGAKFLAFRGMTFNGRAGAVTLTSSDVTTALGANPLAMTHGAIGSLCFARLSSSGYSGSIAPGSTFAGSVLSAAAILDVSGVYTISNSGGALSGTWRMLGGVIADPGISDVWVSLFQRIS